VLVQATMLVGTSSGCGRFGFDASPLLVDDASNAGALDGGTSDGATVLTMPLVQKTDGPEWTPLTGPTLGLPYGILTWEPSGPTFRFRIDASGLIPGTAYTVVQYIDPWPGVPATDMAASTVDAAGELVIPWMSFELDRDLTTTNGKVWLVPSAMIDPVADRMVTWDVTANFFELDFVVYDDTDVP
jgi:hypothetical protein